MGMAASQVRLLQLTGRKNDIGYQLKNLSLQKTALSRDMKRVTRNYQNALNSKVLKWSNNGGASYVDLSYANLMRPGSANKNKPYLITNSSGKVVVDSKYQKYAEMISPDGKSGGDWDSVRTEVLSSITGISAEKIDSAASAETNLDTTADNVNALMEEVDRLQAKAEISGTETEFLEACFGSSWNGAHVSNGATSASTIANDYNGASTVWILGTDLSSSKSQLKGMIETMGSRVSAFLSDEDNEAFQRACETTISNYNTYLETSGEQCGATCQTSWDTDGYAAGHYVVNINLLITELLRNYRTEGGTTDSNGRGDTVYCWYDKNSAEYQEYAEKLAELEAAKEEYGSLVDSSNQILTAEEENSINFYDQLFSAIADKGWVADSQAEDNDYLNNMLQNNQYYITTMSSEVDEDGEEYLDYATDIASNCSNIFSVNDSDAQNEALVQYEYEKSVINEKEARIDTRMENLQTEQSAINEMIKGIETVKNDNTERTFGIFA